MNVGNAFDEREQINSVGLAIQVALSEHCAIVTFPAFSHQSSSWEPTNVELYSKLTLGFVTGSPQLIAEVVLSVCKAMHIIL